MEENEDLARIISLFVVLEDGTLKKMLNDINDHLARVDIPEFQVEALESWKRIIDAELNSDNHTVGMH